MIDYLKPKVKEIGFFSGLDEDLCEKLVEVGNLVTKKKGEYLVIQGRRHSGMSLIISGEVSVKISANGENIKVAKLESGDVVGEMSIIVQKKRVLQQELFLKKLNSVKLAPMISMNSC